MPDLPMRYGKTFATARVGQNINDGDSPSFNTGAYQAETIVSGFSRHRDVIGGVSVQNIIPEDRLVIPETIALPSYSWENLKAETYKAQVSGQAFLPVPGSFAPAPGSVPRGNFVHSLRPGRARRSIRPKS